MKITKQKGREQNNNGKKNWEKWKNIAQGIKNYLPSTKVVENGEIMERWREYYQDLLNGPQEQEEYIEDDDRVETEIKKIIDKEKL